MEYPRLLEEQFFLRYHLLLSVAETRALADDGRSWLIERFRGQT